MAGPSILRAIRRLAILPSVAFLALVVAGIASAASPPPAGPPYPDPVDGQAVYDYGNVIGAEAEQTAERIIDAIEAQTKAEVVVYTQNTGRDTVTTDEAEADAQALMDQWGVGRRGIDDGLVILYDLDSTGKHGQVQLYAGPGLRLVVPLDGRPGRRSSTTPCCPRCASGDFDGATLAGLAKIAQGTLAPTRRDPGRGSPAANAPPPGPPFPRPGDRPGGLRLRRPLLARHDRQRRIDHRRIEARTGAEVVVFSQPLGHLVEHGGDRGAGARAHGPVARRAARASTTAS